VSPDDPAIGQLGPGKEPDQRRLARAVHPEDAKIMAGFKRQADVIEYGPSPAAPDAIGLGNAIEPNHCGS
jgi:hypothetical protein